MDTDSGDVNKDSGDVNKPVSDFIHIAGTAIHIALESTIHITGIGTQKQNLVVYTKVWTHLT